MHRQLSHFKLTELKIIAVVTSFAVLFTGTIVFADSISTSVSVGNAAPTISGLSMNGGNDITLTEGSFTWATSTMTVTDTNGCSEISEVTATFYFGSTTDSGTSCSADDNTCYIGSCSVSTSGNTCDGGSDTSAQYECSFKLWSVANPTDASSPFSNSIWVVSATSSDGTDEGTASNTGEATEINTLTSLNVSSSISYGAVSAGANTGSSNQSITLTNTGNSSIDADISGDSMCTDYPTCAGDSFSQSNQKFDTSDVTYSSLSHTLASTSEPATIALDLAKPTSTTTPVTDVLYWGIAVPSGQAAGSYTSQNTVAASAD